MLLELAQKLLPNKIKSLIKPYFRKIFPNKIMASIWITFRCNYKCKYCPYCGMADYSKIFPISCEKTGSEWISALETLPPTSFYIQGGEPFLYKDLPYLINNMPQKHTIIGVITNASLPMEIYKEVKKHIHLNISYHREFATDENEFINKVLQLNNLFQVSVNIVATPENFNFIKNNLKIFDKNNIKYHIDPLILNANEHYEYDEEYKNILSKYMYFDRTNNLKFDKSNMHKKSCSAGKNYYNLVPNGDAYACSRSLDYWNSPLLENIREDKFKLGNIFEKNFKLNSNNIICTYKCINHCDWDYADIKVIK